MQGAPSVVTNPFQQSFTSDPQTDQVAQTIRSKHVVAQIPVWQPAYQFSVPEVQKNMGWKASNLPSEPKYVYEYPRSAPSVNYTNKSYSSLVAVAANPRPTSNRQRLNLTAPPITTTYGS